MAARKPKEYVLPDYTRADDELPGEPATPKSGLKIHPNDATKALQVLQAYVAERVALAQDRARIGDHVAAIKLFDAIYRFKEMVKEMVKTPAEALYDTLRFNVVPSLMEDCDITTITIDDVGRCNIQDDVSVTVLNKEGLHGWLVENELEDMIVENVNAQTLAAFVRRRLKEAAETRVEAKLPTDFIEIKPVTRAQITR